MPPLGRSITIYSIIANNAAMHNQKILLAYCEQMCYNNIKGGDGFAGTKNSGGDIGMQYGRRDPAVAAADGG